MNISSSNKTREKSDYREIRDVCLDQVGKTVYKLDRINQTQEKNASKSTNFLGLSLGFGGLKHLTEELLSSNRKINEDSNTYLMVNVLINPKSGSKECHFTSTVKFINCLDEDMDIGFLFNGQTSDKIKSKCLKPKQEYPIPLEYLENKTDVHFRPNSDTKKETSSYEFNTYSLETFICDKAALNEFDQDEDFEFPVKRNFS